MINVVCDRDSWLELVAAMLPMFRFSNPDEYNERLLNFHGRPLYVEAGGLPIHIYPPGRKGQKDE